MMLRSVSGHTAVLVRNPRWWGTRAVLDRVTVTVSSSTESWVSDLALSSHAVVDPSGFGLGTLAAISAMPNTRSQVDTSMNLFELDFNTKSPVMSRVAAREAVAHLIDRNTLIAKTVGVIVPRLLSTTTTWPSPASPAMPPHRRPVPTTNPIQRRPTSCSGRWATRRRQEAGTWT